MPKKMIANVIEHEVLSDAELQKRLNKAIEFYRSTNLKNPDGIVMGKLYLPRIIHNGKTIDLEEKYKGSIIIASSIGVLPFIPYMSDKGGEVNMYYHELEPYQAFICVDPEDSKRIFIMWTKPAKFDVTGIH